MNERWKIGIGAGIICFLTLWGLWQMMDGMNKPESVQTVAASSASTRTQEKKKPTGIKKNPKEIDHTNCLLYTSPSPRDGLVSRMPSSA